VEAAKTTRHTVPAWRLFLVGILFVLFPIVFHPWWLAIVCIAIYTLLMVLLLRGRRNSESLTKRKDNALPG